MEALEYTAHWTTNKITAVRTLQEDATNYIREQLPRIYSHELIEIIFQQPYCRIGNLVDRGIAQRQTASTYLQQPCGIGVLQEIRSGREKLFVHPKLVILMTQDDNTITPYARA